MARIPQGFIDELISRVDIVELIDARVPLKKAGRDYAACCPFHQERTPSFTVSPAKQFYHCFGCGAHGTALGFLMEYERLDFREAVQALAEQVGMEVPEEAREASPAGPDLYAVLARAARYYRQQLRAAPAAVEYLKQRGLTGEIAREYGIGYAPAGWENLRRQLADVDEDTLLRAGLVIRRESASGAYDRFRDRVMFPIRDSRGRVTGFGGRVLGDAQPKYLNSPETPVFHKGRELYGLYEARRGAGELTRLLVVEGYMDVVALAQHGIRYAVATLGTATTVEHLERLYRVAPEVVFCFDGDRAGRQAGWRALENALPAMHGARQARFLFLPEGEDPDSLVRREGAGAFEQRLASAVPLAEYFLRELAAQTDLASMDGRARLVELARPYLRKVPEGAFRLLLIDRLAEDARVNPEKLTILIGNNDKRVTGRQTPGPRRARPLRLTPVSRAMALLLHKPSLGLSVEEPEELADIGLEGVDLLRQTIELVQERPHLSTGGILEHWRSHEYGPPLMKLAQLDLGVPEEGLEPEFRDAVSHLFDRRREARVERLLQKSREAQLGEQEKQELKRLLAERKR
ncbi:MAG TPA: DNA primase [Gammaproteobacteria bacterium]|nr:DNA primase [Gammaproteobacteria bacterium]